MFSKLQKYFLLFFWMFCLPFQSVKAQGLQDAGKQLGTAGLKSGTDKIAEPELLAGQIIQFVIGFTGVIFLALTVYAGVLWMTAQGNEGQIEKAREIIIRAIVGLAIVMLAYAITLAVSAIFGL